MKSSLPKEMADKDYEVLRIYNSIPPYLLVIFGIILVVLITSIITAVENRVQLTKLRNSIYEMNDIKESQSEFEERLSLMDPVFIYDGLVSYWTFNYDEKGEFVNKDVKVINDVTYVDEGKFGSSVEINGTGSYIDLGYDPLFISDNITISFWVKFNKFSPSENIITNNLYRFYHRQNPESEDIYFLIKVLPLEDTQTFFACDSSWGGWVGVKAQGKLQINEWYNVVGVKSGNNLLIYIDGVKQKELGNCFEKVKSLAIDDMRNLYLGKSEFKGMIDELKIWNRALTSIEIKYLGMQKE